MIATIASNEVRLGRLSQAKPPHLSAPEISHSLFVHGLAVAPRSRPDPGPLWAPSDCIPDPPHSPPVPPFTAVQMAYPSPVHANPGRYSLNPQAEQHLWPSPTIAWLHARAMYPVQSAAWCWSRSPNSFPVSKYPLAPQESSSLPIYGIP